jgi:quercetin dioxygenase-like cupin family protein
MPAITPQDLIALGNSLAVDKDHELLSVQNGEVLLIKLKPQDTHYPPETHRVPETVIAFKGNFWLETADSQTEVREGSLITIPPKVEHWFGAESDALILVIFGS